MRILHCELRIEEAVVRPLFSFWEIAETCLFSLTPSAFRCIINNGVLAH